ncbi:DUF4876 domain-containing protein [Chryseobacterium sp. Ch-15]|uniref:DUF4876 domain-containing protein n=1 Tax=Chryseobacterium muglaense TaxID=2893752 RepID=A0A9Q3YUL0_9FLAO|nr:DUF4876 domain-containing protein [Chryseobacterium muglaense]MBD3903100.1 DUF4876 domain-containing protein [Chryseobacterium muglaense]MCC9035932.1 DUF4876 domain-containing protein [Chryseobacterium muglaense]MCM2553492.1 DUF4876 domain-containing protein [Chryseobacterium muglaense]
MKKGFILLSLVAAMATGFTVVSCSSDDDFGATAKQNGVLTLNFTGENITEYTNLEVEIKEINTGATIKETLKKENAHSFEVAYGSYRITVNGVVIASNEEVRAAGTGQTDITSAVKNLTIPLFVKKFHEDFIIEEIFFTGVKTPDNKNYNSSRYFKITNNTNNVLDAANLIIGQSNFYTTSDDNPTPYNNNLYFPVKGVMILESSNPKLVQPGDFIVVADNAIDHSQNTPTAYDLHKADWEFPSTNPALGQVDNPSVPNADIIYSETNFKMFLMHNRGFESYVIARFPTGENKNTFMQNQKYDYTFVNSAGVVKAISRYRIPNSWIIDGVNNSIPTNFVHTLTAAGIDSGWTSVGATDSDANRFGKSVRRKTAGTMTNGKNLYMDTNNSTNDFTKDAVPSLKNGIQH